MTKRDKPSLALKVRTRLERVFRVKNIDLDGVRLSIEPRHAAGIVRKQILYRTYERDERRFLTRMLLPGDRVLDLGASLGATTLAAARIVGPDNVLAYEANPSLEATIRHNFTINGHHPELRMMAVTGDGRDVSFFVQDGKSSASSLFDRGGSRKIAVHSHAIDYVLKSFRPTVLSMDIEGAEIEIINSTDFEGVRCAVIEMHPKLVDNSVIATAVSRMELLGFQKTAELGRTSVFER